MSNPSDTCCKKWSDFSDTCTQTCLTGCETLNTTSAFCIDWDPTCVPTEQDFIQTKSCPTVPACAASQNCEYSDWENVGTCSQPCAVKNADGTYTAGTQLQQRSITTPATGNGIPCDPSQLTREIPCTGSTTCDTCTYGSYSDWSQTLAPMGPSQQYRTRPLTSGDPSICVDTIDTQNSTLVPLPTSPAGCEPPNWDMIYAICNALTSGNTSVSRTFTVDGKQTCPITDDQLQAMGVCTLKNGSWVQGPPQDCQYSAYTPLSKCSQPCGGAGGIKTQTRSIAAWPRNGGAACDMDSLLLQYACNDARTFTTPQTGVFGVTSSMYIATFTTLSEAMTAAVSDQTCVAIIDDGLGTIATLNTIPTLTTPTGSQTLYTQDCDAVNSEDCQLSPWKTISECPTGCGPPFVSVQSRSIIKQAVGNGKPCQDFPLTQTLPCSFLPSCTDPSENTCIYGAFESTQPSDMTPEQAQAWLVTNHSTPFIEVSNWDLATQQYWSNPYKVWAQTYKGLIPNSEMVLGFSAKYNGKPYLPIDLAISLTSGIYKPILPSTLSNGGFILAGSPNGWLPFQNPSYSNMPLEAYTDCMLPPTATPWKSVSNISTLAAAQSAIETQPTVQLADWDSSTQTLRLFQSIPSGISPSSLLVKSSTGTVFCKIALVPVVYQIVTPQIPKGFTTQTKSSVQTLDAAISDIQSTAGCLGGSWDQSSNSLTLWIDSEDIRPFGFNNPIVGGSIQGGYAATTPAASTYFITLEDNAWSSFSSLIQAAWAEVGSLTPPADGQAWGRMVDSKGNVYVPSLCAASDYWCKWSDCSVPCGDCGTQTVTRPILYVTPDCDFSQLVMQRPCPDLKPCPAECIVGCNGLPCSGHGTCQSDGTCECQEGYSGADCAFACPSDDLGNVCSGKGTCSADTHYECECETGFYGDACQHSQVAYVSNLAYLQSPTIGPKNPCTVTLNKDGSSQSISGCSVCWDSSMPPKSWTDNETQYGYFDLKSLMEAANDSTIALPVYGATCADLGMTSLPTLQYLNHKRFMGKPQFLVASSVL